MRERPRLSRRAVLTAAAAGGAAGLVEALQTGGVNGNLRGGTMALSEAFNVSEDLWIGPDSAKSNVDANSGRVYMASDTQVDYYGDNGSWVEMGIGSSSNPVPSVHTDGLNNTRYIGSGGDLQSLIETVDGNGGGVIEAKSEGLTLTPSDGIAPTTGGNRVVIKNLTIDVTGTSANASGDYINFSSANNITLENVEVIGQNEDGPTWAVVAGDGFRWHDLTLSGGSGGVSCSGVSNVRGVGLEADNIHDTNTGAGAALVVDESDNVHTWGHDFSDVDRGLEVEDATTESSFRTGRVVNADNSGASSPEVQKSVVITRHTGFGATDDILIDDWVIDNCSTGPKAQNNGTGDVLESTWRDITIIDSGAFTSQADETVVNGLTIKYPTTSPTKAVIWSGGDLTIRDLRVSDPASSEAIIAQDGSTLTHGIGRFHELDINVGSGTTNRLLKVNGGLGAEIELLNVTTEGNVGSRGVSVNDGGLTGDGWGMTIENARISMVDFNPTYSINETNNDPVFVTGGWVEHGVENLPTGSRMQDVKGVSVSDIGDEVSVNQAGTETANAEEPQSSVWESGDLVAFTDSGDGSGTDDYLLMPDGSTWIAQ